MPALPTTERTINLMTAGLSAAELKQLLSLCPPQSPLPAFGSALWAEALRRPLAARYVQALSEQALREAQEPTPELSDELYSLYSRTGNRLRFETIYFERQRLLARAAVALLGSGQAAPQALILSFLGRIEALLDEDSWALPAHVHHPSGRDPEAIDLFSAELTNTLAEVLSVFAEVIPPALQERIRQRLQREFNNYLQHDYHWLEATTNWCAVCNQGIAGAALTTLQDPVMLAAILQKAARSLHAFIGGFGDDGACEEGPGYWEYGFGWFAMLNQQLEARSNGRLTLFDGNPKLPLIASYAPAMALANGNMINFSDASPLPLRPSTLVYLGKRLGNEACLRLGKVNYARLLPLPLNLASPQQRLFQLLRLFLCEPDRNSETAALATGSAPDKNAFFPSLGVWAVSRHAPNGNLWELAAKAGHNAEHHNHNDVGSFILVLNNVPLLTEIGMPEYNQAYFSPRRYESMAAHSIGHSLPILCGQPQSDGPQYRGSVLAADTCGKAPAFRADIAAAYPQQAGCQQFTRTLQLDAPRNRCLCTDEIRLEHPGLIESGFISDAQDITLANARTVHIRKEGVAIQLHCDAQSRWERIDTLHYSNHAGNPAQCSRIILRPAGAEAVSQWQATVEISPLP